MVAIPETIQTGPPLILNDPARNPLSDEERAELVWGDEALTTGLLTRQPRPGQAVACSNGYAGRIVSTTLDASGQLRELSLRLGRLWGREVNVPAGWIQTYDGTTVRLGIERRTLRALPSRRSNAQTAAAGQDALRAAGILRGTHYGDVSVKASDGMATLSGHVGTSTDKERAESALREAQGVLEVQNDLVADDDLVTLVAQALARDERTRHETIFVAVSHGVVVLSGLRNSSTARAAAQERTAEVPYVRGVSNYIEAPDTLLDDHAEQHVIQPRVGQEVFASDVALGRVERVIINPHNRRVEAMVVRGQFPDRQRPTARMRSYEMPTERRRLVIPSADVGFITPAMVQLSIDGIAAAGRDDFAPGDFKQPDRVWRPPYPYSANECLWWRS